MQLCSKPVQLLRASDCPCCSWSGRQATRATAHLARSPTSTANDYVVAKVFKRHLASHLEQIALFALPILTHGVADPESKSEAVSSKSDVSSLSAPSPHSDNLGASRDMPAGKGENTRLSPEAPFPAPFPEAVDGVNEGMKADELAPFLMSPVATPAPPSNKDSLSEQRNRIGLAQRSKDDDQLSNTTESQQTDRNIQQPIDNESPSLGALGSFDFDAFMQKPKDDGVFQVDTPQATAPSATSPIPDQVGVTVAARIAAEEAEAAGLVAEEEERKKKEAEEEKMCTGWDEWGTSIWGMSKKTKKKRKAREKKETEEQEEKEHLEREDQEPLAQEEADLSNISL